mgnify:CR=1 FL=1
MSLQFGHPLPLIAFTLDATSAVKPKSCRTFGVTSSSGTTLSTITRDLENRYGGTPPDHQIGTTIRLAVLAEHMEDLNDRVDAVSTVANAAIPVADIQDDDTFAIATATDVASSESIKAYVDTQVAGKASLGLVVALG